MDIERPDELLAYLRATQRIGPDEQPRFRTLAGGVSNRTVLVTRPAEAAGGPRGSPEAWVIKQALSKLRTQADWFSDPARVHREAMGLRWLEKLAPPGTITPLVFEDHEHHLLAMQAVPEPHENWKSMLLAGDLHADHIDQFATILATVHHRSREAAPALQRDFQDRSFFESLRLEPYYAYSAAQAPAAANFLNQLIADTRQRRLALVHGDYSPKNILIRAGRLILLDHEVIHWGDPAFDLGFALTHLLSKAHHLHDRRFLDAAGRFWQAYSNVVEVDACAVASHTLACMLARVVGRSPLEYLGPVERTAQRDAIISLVAARPRWDPPDLIAAIGAALV